MLRVLQRPNPPGNLTATPDAISGGRFTLGLGAGWRAMEFAATGVEFLKRGGRLEEQILLMRRLWSGVALADDVERVTPEPVHFAGVVDRMQAALGESVFGHRVATGAAMETAEAADGRAGGTADQDALQIRSTSARDYHRLQSRGRGVSLQRHGPHKARPHCQ